MKAMKPGPDKNACSGPQGMERDAILSPDGLYRYRLGRRWGFDQGHVLWVMLNPSTADAEVDDPTIRRCIGFSRAWGFDALEVVNLYALRCTRPEHLEHHPDPHGRDNLHHWNNAARGSRLAVLAWGAHKKPRTAAYDPRAAIEAVLKVRQIPTVVLGLTKQGHPRHPLYVKGGIEPTPYVVVAA